MRAKRLCFKCRQPCSPLHECLGKTNRAIIATEESFTEESEITEVDKQEERMIMAEIDEAHFFNMELPMYSVGGIQRLKTMKFKGSIGVR